MIHINKSLKNKQKISDFTDEELLRMYSENGDMTFFSELYKRYIPKVYGLCLKYLANVDNAKDAVMDIFQLLSKKINAYEIKNFNTWLFSVSKNHCLQIIRKEKQTIFVNIDDIAMENDDFFTLIDKEQSEEEISALEYCMQTLTIEQQKSVKLFYYENLSYADIVEQTGYILSKVKSYIQNGKRNLKSCIIKVLKTNQ